MDAPRFERLKNGDGGPTPYLYVANCGPAVGVPHSTIAKVFRSFGEVIGLYDADETGARVVVCYSEDSCARAAFRALDGVSCPLLGGRTLHLRYSILKPTPSQLSDSVSVSLGAEELEIPGLFLLHEFVNSEEEEQLLREVDERPWKRLSKRRVQHYGYEFCYHTRNVNPGHFLGDLPSFVTPILDRIKLFPDASVALNLVLDQMTVNEYPPGVGLSPHIDTHSAFEGCIFSLSLAGPCIMEFRKYAEGSLQKSSLGNDMHVETEATLDYQRKAIYLPPRSMLLLSGEARYGWHHYIPHHKIDVVNNNVIKRAQRRVSFTLRKVRRDPCRCEYAHYCDSQQSQQKKAR